MKLKFDNILLTSPSERKAKGDVKSNLNNEAVYVSEEGNNGNRLGGEEPKFELRGNFNYEPSKKPRVYDSQNTLKNKLRSMSSSPQPQLERKRSSQMSSKKARRKKMRSKQFETLQKEISDLKTKITSIEGAITHSNMISSNMAKNANQTQSAHYLPISPEFENSQLQSLNNTAQNPFRKKKSTAKRRKRSKKRA